MGWNDLNTFSKARIMQLAVNSGITDLRAIRDAYNSYKDGGEKKSLKEKVNSKIKDAAYKISTQEGVMAKGNASLIDIAKALLSKKDDTFVDDNKYAYIYGTGERYPEVKEPIQGFDYSNYLNQSGYKGIKDVYGTINPYKEYHLDPKYKPLLEELAKHKYHFYDNADDLFVDTALDDIGYRDDVANFIHTLGVDDKGNVMVHDSDVYDFNPSDYNYTRGLNKPITKLEAHLMNKIGTPYIIRQEYQPIYYDGTNGISTNIANHLDNLTDADIANITGSGLLQPSNIIESYYNSYAGGGELSTRKFEDGGPSKFAFSYPGLYMWGKIADKVVDAIKGEKGYADIAPAEIPNQAKSEDAIKLQDVLRENGYDIGTDFSDGYFQKNSIKALQSMLLNEGYDIGSSGSAKNGVDGILGDKTRAAYADWLDKGAHIKKGNKNTATDTTALTSKSSDKEEQKSLVYTPIEQEENKENDYKGIHNYGQYYDERFSNYITNTGLDLSNISTKDVPDNKHADIISPYIFNSMDECKTESARNTLECASHITYLNLDDKRGFDIDTNGLRGNAWTMGDNMVKAGGKRLFDIFKADGAPSGKWKDDYKQRTIDFVRSQVQDPEYAEYLSTNLQPGDVVELLYPNSTNFQKAYEDTKGKHQNTHIGYVVSIGGELYIRDNVGNHTTNTQSVHTRRLSSVLNGKERDGVLITGAIRTKDSIKGTGGSSVGVRQGRDMSEFGITPTEKDNASQSRISNDAAYRALGAVYKNKEKLLDDNNLSVDEFNRIAGLTQAIIFKESGSGELFGNQSWVSKSSRLPHVVNETNRTDLNILNALGYAVGTPAAFALSDITGGAASSLNAHAEPSVGLGSVKYQGPASALTNRQRKQMGSPSMVKEAMRSAQPEASGVSTFYALASSFHNVKQLLAKYAPQDIANDQDIIDQLTALSHNQGLNKIEETLINARADGDWEGHMQGLLNASYGKNAMTVRGYNNTNMFTEEERAEVDRKNKEKAEELRNRLIQRDKTLKELANLMAQRESTYTKREFALADKIR